MPVYEIRVPDGRKVRIRADDPQAAEQGARQWYAEQRSRPPKDKRQVGAAEDFGKSLTLSGLPKAVTGTFGGLGDVEGLAQMGADWIAKKTGVDARPAMREATKDVPLLGDFVRKATTGENLLVSSGQLDSMVQKVGGEYYQPQTRAGRYGEKIGEFAPNALGPGGWLRAGLRVVAPAATSEAAREYVAERGGGAKAQMAANVLGALFGGGVANIGADAAPAARAAATTPHTTPVPARLVQAAEPAVVPARRAAAAPLLPRSRQPADVAALAEEFKTPVTKGQQTGDFEQIAFEQAAARNGRGQQAGETMRGGFQDQRQAVQAAAESFAPTVATPFEAAGAVRSGVREAAESARGQKDAAYKALETVNADVSGTAVRSLPDRLDAALNEKFFSPDVMKSLNPRTAAIYGEIKKLAGSAPDDAAALPLRGVERIRQAMNSASRSSQGADFEAMGIMRKEFDTWLDDVVDQKLLTGDPKALDQLKEARRLHRDYRQTYGGGQGVKTEADRLMQKLIADETTDTDAANLLFGRAKITGASGPVEVVKRVKKLSGGQGETWDALRSGAVAKLMSRFNPNATGSDYKAMANDFADALDGSGAPMMRELFSREELNRMRRFKALLERLSPPEGSVNRSGAGYEVSRLVRQTFGSLGSLTPVANKLLASYEAAATNGRARRALEPGGQLRLGQLVGETGRRAGPAAAAVAVPGVIALQGRAREQQEQPPQQ